MPSPSSPRRVIIVGAGFYGIVAAKTYLQVNPSADITIIDQDSAIGGVWSATRVYEGLTYEIPTPLQNFTDFDMCKEFGKGMWEDVTGYELNEFLIRYATKHDILKLCRLSTEVTSIERDGSGWKVFVRSANNVLPSTESLTCDKLITAVGVASIPKLPDWDLSKFDGFHFHVKEMGKRQKELVAENVHNVTIVGGHKSALEAVGTCAQAGKNVEWLVRSKGSGPTWLMPAKDPKGESPAKMTTVRMMAAFNPSLYRKSHFLDRFLHSGSWWLGNWILAKFWSFVTQTVKGDKYKKSANMKKLEPQPDSMFWFVPGGTVVHDRDTETIRLINEEKLIRVNRAEIVSALGRTITLSTGETIPCDALVISTGWQLAYPSMFPPALAHELGLPVDFNVQSAGEKDYWQSLDHTTETEFVERYPMLKNPPSNIHTTKATKTPFRLYRGMIPPKLAAQGDNSLAILGTWANGKVQLTAELASLWAVAYLEGLMPPSTQATLTDLDEMNRDIALVDAYRRKRYLGFTRFRLSIFENPELDDAMFRDLEVRPDRKRMRMPSGWQDLFGLKSWYAEWFTPYFADDYAGFVEEFLEGVETRDILVNGYK